MESVKQNKVQTLLWWSCLVGVSAFSLALRWWNLQVPDIVIWDEHHFLRFSQHYLQNTYFIDVHPPLGKMVVAGVGWLCSMNATFPITEGANLTASDQLWYICMRRHIGVFGVLCVVLVFAIVWQMTESLTASAVAALLVMTDCASLSYSRLILLDPILSAAVLLTVLCHVQFLRRSRHSSYSWLWWLWLLATGAALGLTISVKYVGVFVVALVGMTTAGDLWSVYCDLTWSLSAVFGRFLRYALALVLLPLSLYLALFTLHSVTLSDISKLEGIGVHSAEFRYTMVGQSSSARDVMYGSQVTVLSCLSHAGYLSTSFDTYPPGLGAEQQIVALDPKLDELNYWMFRRHSESALVGAEDDHYVPQPVLHGDLVRLYSVVTETHLHTYRIPASITPQVYQTTSFGEIGEEHEGSVWRVEILGESVSGAETVLTTMTARFRLVNNRTGCVLSAGSDRYPSWGYNTWEVVCDPGGENRIDKSGQLWQIDENLNPKLPVGDFSGHKMSLWQRVLEMHAVMLATNSRLTLSTDSGEDSLQRLLSSHAWMWPILYRGCPGHHGPDFSLYFIGSPHVYLLNALSLIAVPFVLLFSHARQIRHQSRQDSSVRMRCQSSNSNTTDHLCLLAVAWLLHYLPFWTMNRILYFHHYLLPFHFSSMITGLLFNWLLAKVNDTIANKKLASFVTVSSWAALLIFLINGLVVNWPLAYGVDPRVTGAAVSHHFYLNSWKM